MPFEMTRNVQMRRDRDGRVRQLSHVKQPYRPAQIELEAARMAGGALTPRALAEQYLRDVADIYGLAPAAMANFAAAPTPGPSAAPTELRFKEEKAAGGVAAVSYDQTHLGLPIWEAGMTVRIDTAPMQVTGSQNAMHYEIQVTRPDPNAPYLPHRLDPQRLEQVFGLATAPRVNATRMLIYRYEPAERFDPQIAAHRDPGDATGLAGKDAGEFPALPLAPVAASIQAGRHYVVSEVLFTLPYPGWGTLNWRAFVEPETGSVLYLRALVSCVSATVFLTDPVTASGVLHSAGDPAGSLDPLRSIVSLLGLTPAAGAQQELTGEYVRLVEVDPPGTPMPREGAPFDFSYSCKTDNFAACNAYHHCDAVFRLIQGMGIDVATYFNNTDFPVPVDPHALRGQVNAQARGNFTGTGMEAFVFGVARSGERLGIAADVRVVLHEFGHALLWDHVSSPNFGFAHSAGDSLAAILHDPGSRAPDRFETFPFMKASAGLSRRHDRKVVDGWAWGGPPSKDDTQYGSEQILSTTLFRVYQAAGGDAASLDEQRFAARYMAYLIIKACGLLTFRTRDPDVYVAALTDADAGTVSFEGHPGGSLGKVLRWSFEKQGLYDSAPPEVDVYIDDGRSGEYMPYLADFRGSAAVWNRRAADGGPDHEAPRVGLLNHAYVAVQSRGTTPATGIEVRGFQSRLAGARTWPTDWKPMATARIVVPGSLAPGARLVVGPLDWTPQFEGESLLVGVSADGDRSNLESVTAGPILNSRLVPLDNNIAQRTM